MLFSPLDPKTLYFSTNTLWKTSNGGHSWTEISPDLTRRDSVVSPSIGIYSNTPQAKARHPGVIYAVAPSPKAKGVIWAGSDDGLIHVTMNGGRTWKNVTPAELVPWSKVSVIDASAHDSLAAYAAINTLRLSELKPHIYRTQDGGKTWAQITNGIPDGATINAVRADPKRAGLLFAGSETAVYYSIDDGEHWQSLRLNMPATSIRDLVIKDDDLVAGTHGRGFWILDDITPLRQLSSETATGAVTLFRPQVATRARWTQWPDTPLPQEEPAGKNPPDGVPINYYLKDQVSGPVTLEILDRSGAVVRRYSSSDPPEAPIEGRNIPDYWIKPPQVLSPAAGIHRFYWDMRTPPPAVLAFSYPISAIYGATPQGPLGVWVLPGSYTVRLTAGGVTRTAPLTIRMDPRVKAGPAVLQEQFGQSMRIYQALRRNLDALTEVRAVRRALEDRGGRASGTLTEAIRTLDQKLGDLEGSAGGFGAAGARGRPAGGLARLNGDLATLLDLVQGVDAAPTTQASDAIREKLAALAGTLADWGRVRFVDLSRVNAALRQANLAPIESSR